jgi:hypothetical protein
MDFNNKIKPQKAKPKWNEQYKKPLMDFLLKDDAFKQAGKFADDNEYQAKLDEFIGGMEHEGILDFYLTDVEDQGGSWVKMPDGTYVNLDDLYDDFKGNYGR